MKRLAAFLTLFTILTPLAFSASPADNRNDIVFLSDFGLQDDAVSQCKAAIYNVFPQARVTDMTHNIAPYNTAIASFLLADAAKMWPSGTVFLAVVDPGVGSSRKAVALRTKTGHFFVGPDNGLIYPAASADNLLEAAEVPISGRVSPTFHGRDVMAPAAAAIDLSKKISSFNRLSGIQGLDLISCSDQGMIVKVDRFGNLVTNIACAGAPAACVVASNGDAATLPFYATYEAARPATPFLIKGSSGMYEISVKADRAAKFFPAFRPGAPIRVTPADRC